MAPKCPHCGEESRSKEHAALRQWLCLNTECIVDDFAINPEVRGP